MSLGVDYASIDKDAPPNWPAAIAAGVRFVLVRGSYQTWHDSTYKRDVDAARAAGLLTGAYMFPVMGTAHPTAAEQVKAFADAVGDLSSPLIRGHGAVPLGFPPVLDVEFPGGIKKTGLSPAEIMAWIRDAIAELRRTYGVAPMLYTSARVWDGDDADSLGSPPAPDLIDCPLWLARYPFKERIKAQLGFNADMLPAPPVPRPWGDATNWWIHQWQGDALGFPGFTSTVDINRFHMIRHREQRPCDQVRWMQRRLGIEPTGTILEVDERALVEFQIANGLESDGVIGPATFAALCWSHP